MSGGERLSMNEIDEKPADQPAGDPPPAEYTAAGDAPERKAEENASGPVEPGPKPAGPVSPPPGKTPQAKPTDKESIIETIKTVVYALLIALVIRTFLFQPFNIPSGSMEQTLLVGDYLFVEKFAYGYSQYSFPWGLGPISGRIWAGKGPTRGDVIVFKLPRDNSTDYIKRLIGLPGDRIQMINGQLYINGAAVKRVQVSPYISTDAYKPCSNGIDESEGQVQVIPRYRETLPNGKSYYTLACNSQLPQNNTPVYVVPAGHYFMMGDNRDNSSDSRFSMEEGGVGYVPAANLEGKAEFIFFSNDGPLWEFWTWPWTVRFSRMFTSID
jgi:signal peptidase I